MALHVLSLLAVLRASQEAKLAALTPGGSGNSDGAGAAAAVEFISSLLDRLEQGSVYVTPWQ